MVLGAIVVCLFVIWTSVVQAQSFLDVINQQNLTELNTTLSSFPDLFSQISNTANVTFLAPTNDAFESLRSTPNGQALRLDPGLMRAVLTYHLLQGVLTSVINTQIVPSMLNDPLYTNVTTGQVVGVGRFLTNTIFLSGLAQNITVMGSPLQFSGGVIYLVDQFLTLPASTSDTAAAANATSFIRWSELARLKSTVNEFPGSTILVPVNNAFGILDLLLSNMTADQLTKTMAYHIVNGTVVYETLSSYFEVPTSLEAYGDPFQRDFGGVSTGLQSSSLFLQRSFSAHDMEWPLEVAEVHYNHSATDLRTDYNITVREIGSTYFLNNARILVPDLLTANGVMHIIDQVLNPENRTVVELAASDSGLPAFADAYGVQTTTASVQPPTSTNSPGQESASRSSVGAIVGGVVGGLLGIGLVAFLVWFVQHKGYTFKLEKSQKSAAIITSESDGKERYEMPDAKRGVSHEVDGDEKRLFEVPETGDRRAELPAMNKEPVEIDGDEMEVKPRD